jgi:hypothetical protein
MCTPGFPPARPEKEVNIMKAIQLTLLLSAILLMSLMAMPTARSTTNPVPPLPVHAADDPVFIGAGDIGRCPQDDKGKYISEGTHAEATAQLVASLLPSNPDRGVVFVAGDNAYQEGTAQQYAECYGPTWGRFKNRTHPVPGNHEFIKRKNLPETWYGNDYYDYFGISAGRKYEGYYSYDLGEWHIIAINSELQNKFMTRQIAWLRKDLQDNKRRCTLAYWHRPVFSSGEHGFQQKPIQGIEQDLQGLWRLLDEMGVDVVVNGHDHNYERFKPQDADRKSAPDGMVEFVVGTGGESLRDKEIPPGKRRNSAAFNRFTWGVLKLTLHPDSYDYEFIPVASEDNQPMFRERSSSPVQCVE